MSRTHTTHRLPASVLLLILTGCGASSPDGATRSASAAPALLSEQAAASTQPATSAPSSAKERMQRLERMRAKALPTGDCTLLSEATLRSKFPNAPTEMEIRVRANPYPSCTYLWTSATPNKISMAGQVVEVPGEGRVTITVAPVRAPESDWQRVLSSYRTVPPVSVDGIGDKAVWSDQRHQLSVLVPGFVAHVAVEDDDNPGSGREQAIALARDVLASLR